MFFEEELKARDPCAPRKKEKGFRIGSEVKRVRHIKCAGGLDPERSFGIRYAASGTQPTAAAYEPGACRSQAARRYERNGSDANVKRHRSSC